MGIRKGINSEAATLKSPRFLLYWAEQVYLINCGPVGRHAHDWHPEISLLKDLGRSLLGRLLSLGVFALGFWLLYQGLLRDDNPYLLVLGTVLGSALILGGLYLMATTRRIGARQIVNDSDEDAREDEPVDSLNGSGKSD